MGEVNSFTCEKCENKVNDDFEFCPLCGTIFIEGVNCVNHVHSEAKGVCLICESPFCKKCGSFDSGKFFCDEHGEYETYQGMTRVYGSSDHLQINYLKSILQSEGLHPFVYARKASALSLGGPEYSLFNASGDVYSHLINEIKLLVPFSEVLTAEKILEEHSTENEGEGSASPQGAD